MSVEFWSEAIPGDLNHKYEMAEYKGVVFCKFPYAPYLGRFGSYSIRVSGNYDCKIGATQWGASIHKSLTLEERLDSSNPFQDSKFIKQIKDVDKEKVFIEAVDYVEGLENGK